MVRGSSCSARRGSRERSAASSASSIAYSSPSWAPAVRLSGSTAVAVQMPLGRLVESGWHPNRLPEKLLAKLRSSVCEFGVVENLVARPHPEQPGQFEVLSGNQRLRLYRELGLGEVPVVVVEVDDGQARLLAQ